MRKAVIVSDVRALADMVRNGETGLIFGKGNADSLAEGLRRLLDDAGLRQRLGENGRAFVEAERNWRFIGQIAHDTIQEKLRTQNER